MSDVNQLLKDVFSCGGLTASDFAAKCPSLEAIVQMPWFKIDLPEGAAKMCSTYQMKTKERRDSEAYSRMKELLENAVSSAVTNLTAKMQDASLEDEQK